MSRDMRYPTIWYVRPPKAQTSLCIRAAWSEPLIVAWIFYFGWDDFLRPINNLSVIKGRVFLGWTSSKLGSMFLLKDTTQWLRGGSNPRPLGLESITLSLSHCALLLDILWLLSYWLNIICSF